MTDINTIDEYRAALAVLNDAGDLSAICLGAVFTGDVSGSEESTTGTIVAIRHRLGMGVFGQTTYTHVKLCRECVHRASDDCPPLEDLEWLQVLFIEKLERNGDAGGQVDG